MSLAVAVLGLSQSANTQIAIRLKMGNNSSELVKK